MPTLSLTLSAENLNHLVTAVCENHHYDSTKGETPLAFTKRMLVESCQREVRVYDRKRKLVEAEATLTPLPIT